MTRLGHAAAGSGPARKWVALFALLTFFLQSLALQTHIHQQLPLTAGHVAEQGSLASAPAKSPLKNQDPMDQCRLCQELVHAGSFVTPSAAIAPISQIFAAALFATLPASLDRSATAFTWRSRAPPRR